MKPPETTNLPDLNHLSQVTATLMLAYLIGRFVNLPIKSFDLQIVGVYLSLEINLRSIMAILVGLLAASGADWMIREHPVLKTQTTIEHWLLPALTAWVVSVPLYQLPIGILWWGGFLGGSLLIMLILIAEYIVVDHSDRFWAPASIFIHSILFALFLALTISMHSVNMRLVFFIPSVALSAGLISLRVLKLRTNREWSYQPILIVVLIISQITGALHYLPLSSIQFGILLTGLAYALISILTDDLQTYSMRHWLFEASLILLLSAGLAIWMH